MRGREEDEGETRLWLGAHDDDDVKPPPNRVKWIALGLVIATGLVVTAIVVVASRKKDSGTKATDVAGAATNVRTGADKAKANAWVSPKGTTRSIQISAVGFASMSEADLGTLFDAKLEALHGAPNLYAETEQVKVERNEFQHAFNRVTSKLELGLVVSSLLGGSYRNDRLYATYRALQIGSITKVDERATMVEPPAGAVYYLAEVHVGSSYDVLIEGTSRDMGARLDRKVTQGKLDFSATSTKSSYRIVQRGLGLRPKSGEAIFATTADAVAHAYTTDGAAVPVRLVFRQIPGRSAPPDAVPWPQTVLEQTFSLGEGKSKSFHLDPGAYTVHVTTRPKGVVVRWNPKVDGCRTGDFLDLTTFCTLRARTALTIENFTEFYTGPDENITLTVLRGRDPSAVESATQGD
ncbi:MAG: hypothetical protein KF773_16935 [Deltaproteobacteria bacterium]|nr:hypothetical protein [Deltaproteobacteria bacterium]